MVSRCSNELSSLNCCNNRRHVGRQNVITSAHLYCFLSFSARVIAAGIGDMPMHVVRLWFALTDRSVRADRLESFTSRGLAHQRPDRRVPRLLGVLCEICAHPLFKIVRRSG